MPPVDINYLAVLVGGLVNMAVGAFWYSPKGFGKQWMALSGINPDKIDAAKAKGMQKLYMLAFIGALVMSYVFAHFIDFAEAATIAEGMQAGFWSWLGFIAPVTLSSVLWEGKPWKLYILNNAYYLVVLLIIGPILAVWT